MSAGERRRAEEARAPVRDMTPAVGAAGGPAGWRRAVEGAAVALHRKAWEDGRWSFLFKDDTRYASAQAPPDEELAAINRRGRHGAGEEPVVQGPVMKPPVWTWEVPLYFWFGGMAAGASFVALACDLAGDRRSARIARLVTLGAILPSPPLLIMDLGRPERFYNMLRIFKPRSPMSTGAWALSAFSGLAGGAVAVDLLEERRVPRMVRRHKLARALVRRRAARPLGAGAALVGGYFGSYTGVLLASTAVPVWARSKLFLGPIFVTTGAATGAAACRLVLVATGLPPGHPTREALGRVETGAMATELILSQVNEARLGPLAGALEEGKAGRWLRAAKGLVHAGLALRLLRHRGAGVHHVASACYLGAGLCFRYAWVEAGKQSARDDEAVADTARHH